VIDSLPLCVKLSEDQPEKLLDLVFEQLLKVTADSELRECTRVLDSLLDQVMDSLGLFHELISLTQSLLIDEQLILVSVRHIQLIVWHSIEV
jgi:cell division protein ZapA (FtsZ GTPase activity inhibitor)